MADEVEAVLRLMREQGDAAEMQRKVGALEERLRVMRILRSMEPRDAAKDDVLTHTCVELFRADLLDAVAQEAPNAD